MIQKLELKNFQSHKDSMLNFSKGLNIIIGTSNSGKSSILRGIRLVSDNKPSGDSFIQKGTEKSEVALVIDDKKIIRSKSKKENKYFIDKSEFKAFGQDVPEEVKELLNLSEVNTHSQLDPPFLLSQTSGEIAKYFNSILNLSVIDSSQKKIKSQIMDNNKKLSFFQEELKLKKGELEILSWVDDAYDQIQKIEELEKVIESKKITFDSLADSLLGIKKIKGKLLPEKMMKVFQTQSKNFQNKFNLVEEKKEDIRSLSRVISSMKKTSEKIIPEEIFNQLCKDLEAIEKQKVFGKSRKENLVKLQRVLEEVNHNKDLLEILAENIQKDEKELKKITPEVCPLCHQKIKSL